MVMSEETVLTERVLCWEDDDGRWTMLIAAGLVGTEGIMPSTELAWEALGVRLPVLVVVYRDMEGCISGEDMVP